MKLPASRACWLVAYLTQKPTRNSQCPAEFRSKAINVSALLTTATWPQLDREYL